MAIALLTAEKMRELDRVTIEEIGIPGPVLMEVAGRACAEGVEDLDVERKKKHREQIAKKLIK